MASERDVKPVQAGIEAAIKRVRSGRTIVNFGHIPEVVRALEWVWMDLGGINPAAIVAEIDLSVVPDFGASVAR